MNNDNFLLEDSDLEQAKDICKYIENDTLRERAVANCLSAEVVSKYFVDTEVDTKSGIHNVSGVLEDIEISDIYIKNNYIDVRLYFNENELCVPKTHFDMGITPIAYMFIKVDEDLSNCSVSGFMPSENIDTSVDCKSYYKVNLQDLVSFYDIEQLLTTNYEDEYSESFEKDVFDYLDGKLVNKNEFYRTLLKSHSAREYLINASKAKNAFSFVSVVKDSDSTLQPDMVNTESIDDNLLSEPIEEAGSLTLDLEQPTDLDTTDSGFDLTEVASNDELILHDEETIDIIEHTEDNFEIANSDLQEYHQEGLGIDIPEESTSTETYSEVLSEQMMEYDNKTEDLSAINMLEDTNNEPDYSEISDTEFNSISAIPDAIQSNDNKEITDSDIDELAEFNYTTDISPSIDTIENSDLDDNSNKVDAEQILEEDTEVEDTGATDNNVISEEEIPETFSNEFPAEPEIQTRKSSPILPLIAVLVVLGTVGYFGYTKYQSSMPDNISSSVTQEPSDIQDQESQGFDQNTKDEAMPVESVENTQTVQATNEGTSVSIPAIEQNLDASILVSNLSVNWEVPQSYTTNSSAKRYLIRIGKVMQLNLKAELLLLSKPPITNKIAIELQYNKNAQKFAIKELTTSSGEKSVDDVVKAVVQSALNMNLGSNMQIFDNLQGNPVLIIKL